MRQDIIDRYISGHHPDLLAMEAGVSPRTITVWVHRDGRSNQRWKAIKAAAMEVADHLCDIAQEQYDVDIRARDRRHKTILVKHAVMLVMHRDGHSLTNIAAGLHLDDHTTVLHGLRVAEGCPDRRRIAQEIMAELEA